MSTESCPPGYSGSARLHAPRWPAGSPRRDMAAARRPSETWLPAALAAAVGRWRPLARMLRGAPHGHGRRPRRRGRREPDVSGHAPRAPRTGMAAVGAAVTAVLGFRL